jgi:hypothetical protein
VLEDVYLLERLCYLIDYRQAVFFNVEPVDEINSCDLSSLGVLRVEVRPQAKLVDLVS